MERNFTTTIQLEPAELVQDPDIVILAALRKKYENVCFGRFFIIKVLKINARSNIAFNRNQFPSMPFCDVVFTASYITYNINQLVLLKIDEIKSNTVLSSNSRIIADTPLKEVEELFTPEVGRHFIAVIDYLNYENFSKIAMNVVPYDPMMGFFITRITPGTVDEILLKGTADCIKVIENLKANKNLAPINAIFNKKNNARISLKKYTIFEKPPIIEAECIVAICSYDPAEEGIYYIGHSADELKGHPSTLVASGVPLEAVLFDYANNIFNILTVFTEIAELPETEFKANKEVWEFYRKR